MEFWVKSFCIYILFFAYPQPLYPFIICYKSLYYFFVSLKMIVTKIWIHCLISGRGYNTILLTVPSTNVWHLYSDFFGVKYLCDTLSVDNKASFFEDWINDFRECSTLEKDFTKMKYGPPYNFSLYKKRILGCQKI